MHAHAAPQRVPVPAQPEASAHACIMTMTSMATRAGPGASCDDKKAVAPHKSLRGAVGSIRGSKQGARTSFWTKSWQSPRGHTPKGWKGRPGSSTASFRAPRSCGRNGGGGGGSGSGLELAVGTLDASSEIPVRNNLRDRYGVRMHKRSDGVAHEDNE